MELRLDTRALQDAVARAKQLLKDRRLVVVFGDRLTLMSFCVAEPIRPSLVGAATTEDEGFELVRRTQPDLLICSSDLETGYGPYLLRRVKAIPVLSVADCAGPRNGGGGAKRWGRTPMVWCSNPASAPVGVI